MRRYILFYIKLLLLTFLVVNNLYAVELSIIPLKKPILDEITKQNKITQGVIRPKPKPIKKVEKQELVKEVDKPKPIKKVEQIITKKVEKKIPKIDFIIPTILGKAFIKAPFQLFCVIYFYSEISNNIDIKTKKNVVKRPLTGYNIFMQESMKQVKIDNPDLIQKDVMKESVRLWHIHKAND